MRFEKGNKFGLGNNGGVPKVYTQEYLKNEAKELLEWIHKSEKNVWIKRFAHERGYSAQRLSEFAKDSEEFSEALKIAKEIQEQRLIELSLWNKTNFQMSKLVLVNSHNWTSENAKSDEKKSDTGMLKELIAELKGTNVPAKPETETIVSGSDSQN